MSDDELRSELSALRMRLDSLSIRQIEADRQMVRLEELLLDVLMGTGSAPVDARPPAAGGEPANH